MRRRRSTLAVLFLCASLSMAAAESRAAETRREIDLASSHRSASGVHKLLVPASDTRALAELEAAGAVVRSIDYEDHRLLLVTDAALGPATRPTLKRLTMRDDFDLIGLNGWTIDTRSGEPKDLPAERKLAPGTSDRQLYVVQFIGPVKSNWIDSLTAAGDVEVIGPVPQNGFLVRAGREAWRRLAAERKRPDAVLQWVGVYHPAYRISQRLEPAIQQDLDALDVVVQLVDSPHGAATARRLRREALAVLAEEQRLGGLRDVAVRISAAELLRLASDPEVVWIEPRERFGLFGERQAQIVAGATSRGLCIFDDGTPPCYDDDDCIDGFCLETVSQPEIPLGPGYFEWLEERGLTGEFDFVVDVADTGFDLGSTSDVHPDFEEGGVSRIEYVKNYSDSGSPEDRSGHGTVDISIVGSFNDATDEAHADAEGFRYGMGIAPTARIGSSKVIDDDGYVTSELPWSHFIAGAYNAGARVSSNSWGASVNEYTVVSRAYDQLVRDADSGTPGPQEISIVFAAGNDGYYGYGTVGSPGTAKNVITVGASENYRNDLWNDADDARDVAWFSSRGPTADGRNKPDLLAPGTYILGAASRATWPLPHLTPWPHGQELYGHSSGTSQATPAVAGAAALVRQYFINRNWGTPSPAMTKAVLIAGTTYLFDLFSAQTLPSPDQGYGRVTLRPLFDGTPTRRFDQGWGLIAPGQRLIRSGSIADPTKPFRVVLAWTDPAPTVLGGAAWVNDLDLEVEIGGDLYRGNVFDGALSLANSGAADTMNNTEAVFLPEGTSGDYTVTVRATALNGDGIPGNQDTSDQDFALFVYNGTPTTDPDYVVSASPGLRAVVQGESAEYTVSVESLNGFDAGPGGADDPVPLSVIGLPAGAAAVFSENPVAPPVDGAITSTLTVTTSPTTPFGTYGLTIKGGQTPPVWHAKVPVLVVETPDRLLGYGRTGDLAIPDNDGVTSYIGAYGTRMLIKSVSVYARLAHPDVGQLRLSLIGPDGTTVVLRDDPDRVGDSIDTTFPVSDGCRNPGPFGNCSFLEIVDLDAFAGKDMYGPWYLRVDDVEPGLTGTLEAWKLTFNGHVVVPEDNLHIPNNDRSGIVSSVDVTATGPVDSVRARVNIVHPSRGDLKVTLVGPGGSPRVVLHDQTGGTLNDLVTAYPERDCPVESLAAFEGVEAQGTWTLEVRDLALGSGSGFLRDWSLDLAVDCAGCPAQGEPACAGGGAGGTSFGCGDGFVDPGEECDDANDVGGDGCTECRRDFGGGGTIPGAVRPTSPGQSNLAGR